MAIMTPRLELVPLHPELLRALLAEDLQQAAALGGFAIDPAAVPKSDTLLRRLHQLEADPRLQPWLLRAMVERQSGQLCGHIGFHDAPGSVDLAEIAPDGVEMGYSVHLPFRRRGYAREAILALMQWARETRRVSSFVLSISPDNAPSLALAQSLGFAQVGEQMDETDGLELIFLRVDSAA